MSHYCIHSQTNGSCVFTDRDCDCRCRSCLWYRSESSRAPLPTSPSPLLSPSEKLIESTLTLSVKMDELTRLLKARTEAFQDPTFLMMHAKMMGQEISLILEPKTPSQKK